MNILNTPESFAAMVVRLGYVTTDRERTIQREALVAEYGITPEHAREVLHAAEAVHRRDELETDRVIRALDDHAIAAEHDTDLTMHPTEEG